MQLRAVRRSRARYDQRTGAFLGYETLPGHDGVARGDPAGLRRMQAEVQRALGPTAIEVIEPWLAELSLIAPARQHDPMTDELRMSAYSSRLAEYPPDVVRHVLLVMVWRFWPSWAELHEACEAAVSPRRAMLLALDAATLQARSGDRDQPSGRAPGEYPPARKRGPHKVQVESLIAELREKMGADR